MLMQTSAVAAQAASVGENVRLPDLRYRREVPVDFATQAPLYSIDGLEQLYNTNWRNIARWLEETGVESRGAIRGRPVPADFAERAAAMHRAALGRHYDVKFSVIDRWLAELGIAAAKPPVTGQALGRPVPPGFAVTAPTLNISQLRTRYQVGDSTVRRWLKLADVVCRPSPKRFGHPPAARAASVASDIASQAAHHLRRFHTAVYSCTILEKAARAKIPDKGIGRWYVAGRGYLTAGEVITAAQAKGFDAGSWARL